MAVSYSNPQGKVVPLSWMECLFPDTSMDQRKVIELIKYFIYQFTASYGYPPEESNILLFHNLPKLQELIWYQYVLLYLVFYDKRVYEAVMLRSPSSSHSKKDRIITKQDLAFVYFHLRQYLFYSIELIGTPKSEWTETDAGWISKEEFEKLVKRYQTSETQPMPTNPRLLVWTILRHFL